VARVREVELLTTTPTISGKLIGIAILVAILGGAVPADAGDAVFFKNPDRATALRIKSAIDDLKRNSISDHTRGRATLEEIGYWAVRPLQDAVLNGKNPSLRGNAALVLGTIRDPRGLPYLLRSAEHDSHGYVPAFATLVIGKFKSAETLPRLRRIRKEAARYHRIAAVLAIAKTEAPGSFELLEETLRTENQSLVREAAIFCLGFFRDKALVPGKGGVAVPCDHLLKALRSAKEGQRRSALIALALLGHRDLKSYYWAHATKDKDPGSRRIALLALGRFPDEDVTKLLLATLGNIRAPAKVRIMAAFLLKDRKDPMVLGKLLEPNQDNQLKAALTLALSNFDDPKAVDKMIYRLTDQSDQVQAAAAIGLSRLKDPDQRAKAIKAITRRLQGDGGNLHKTVRHNLERSRAILRDGEAPPGEFLHLGNDEFVADLPKDVEERVLDFVNREAERVLELTSLTPLIASQRDPTRFRVSDEKSDLRDLKEYLDVHPYFEPADIPEPKVSITPRPEPLVGPDEPRNPVPGADGKAEPK